MLSFPEPIARLSQALNRLPGIGPRSAERLSLHLVQTDPVQVQQLAEALISARERVKICQICGGLTEDQPCGLCADTRRDAKLLCVVEQPVDIIALEKTHAFDGRYHVLGGKISPLNGVGPDDLRIEILEDRVRNEPIEEVVIALGTDVEGDATSHYLAQRLASTRVKVTRIAFGLPAGSNLEYTDEVTLSRAMEGRRELL